MMSDYVPMFQKCPRCGGFAFEDLKTYSHCAECLYSEDRYYELETIYHQAVRIERTLPSGIVIPLPIKSNKQKGEAS